MAVRIEKFTSAELTSLRNELLHSGLDSWQAADVIGGFLTGRGYGANSAQIRTSVMCLEGPVGSLERMQEELERIAFMM
jgi:hypothetical protein